MNQIVIIAIDLPTWALKEIDKIRQDFLWKGVKELMAIA